MEEELTHIIFLAILIVDIVILSRRKTVRHHSARMIKAAKRASKKIGKTAKPRHRGLPGAAFRAVVPAPADIFADSAH